MSFDNFCVDMLNMLKQLNIFDLQRKINQKTQKITACFERILELCHKRILFHAERKQMRFFFEVPEYLFGYPLYDLNDAIRFVVNALTQNGFLAVYYFPRFVYISWDMKEIEHNKQGKKRLQNSVERGLDFKYKPSGKLTLDID